MGTPVYFGAGYARGAINGNWRDITQWYSSPGYTGEGSYPGEFLNRFPNPNTDDVYLYQNVRSTSNVGTYVGTYPNGSWQSGTTYAGTVYGRNVGISDPNAVWTGTMYDAACYAGTFAGNFVNGVQQAIVLYGGTFTNANFSQVTRLRVYENNPNQTYRVITTPNSITFPATLNMPNLLDLTIGRQMNWNFPITFAGTGGSLSIYRGACTNELPTISQDISTTLTNCTNFNIYFENLANDTGTDVYESSQLGDLNTIFTNSAPIIIGSPSKPASFTLQFVAPNRELTFYVKNGTSNSLVTCAALTPTYDKLNIIEATGSLGATVNVYSAVTWKPTINLSLNNTNDFSKYKLNTIPRKYGFTTNFGANSAKFQPVLILALPTNLNADI